MGDLMDLTDDDDDLDITKTVRRELQPKDHIKSRATMRTLTNISHSFSRGG